LSPGLILLIAIPAFLAGLAIIVLVLLKLGVIVSKATEAPDPGESTRYSLEQGRDTGER
jgi:hypothetical protein